MSIQTNTGSSHYYEQESGVNVGISVMQIPFRQSVCILSVIATAKNREFDLLAGVFLKIVLSESILHWTV